MKSKLKPAKEEQKEKPFPKLMVSDDIVILATSRGDDEITGMTVHEGDDFWHMAFYSETWDAGEFADYPGKVILSND